MKNSYYKQGLYLVLIYIFASFISEAQEVTKEFHQEFGTDPNTVFEISNMYGDITVHGWDKKTIIVDAKVTIELYDKEEAEKYLNYIDVEFSKTGDLISAKTIINEKFNFRGWGAPSRKFSISYNVKMPFETAFAIANKYGNTFIDELHGLVNFNIKYGNITIGKLTRGNTKPLNKLSVSYGKGKINETGWLNLTLRYCNNMQIEQSRALLIDSKYSKLNLGKTSSVAGRSKYDNFRIEYINNMAMNNGYSEINIGTLANKLDYSGSYGSFSADYVPAGFESIKIATRYMGIKLGVDESANYILNVKASYSGVKYNENNFNIQKRIIENNKKEIYGIMGNEDKAYSSTIDISSSYGSVKLY